MESCGIRWKLEGADDAWSQPSTQRAVNYASLAPGSYRFLVRAVNSDALVSEMPATVLFTVLPPIWGRWWFIMLVALALTSARSVPPNVARGCAKADSRPPRSRIPVAPPV